MGDSSSIARAKLVDLWESLGSPAGVFRAAAESIVRLPQPLMEPAEKTERLLPYRDQLGVMSADEQIAAALRARELLESLSRDFG